MKIAKQIVAKAVIATLLLSSAAPVMAKDLPGEGAQITLAAPAKKKDFILDGVFWTCKDTVCTVGHAPDLPVLRTCQRVVAVTGAATAFTLRGVSLSADELAQCNVRAKA